jgi:hypothetical protein
MSTFFIIKNPTSTEVLYHNAKFLFTNFLNKKNDFPQPMKKEIPKIEQKDYFEIKLKL